MPKLVYGLFAHKMPKSVKKEKKSPKPNLVSRCAAFAQPLVCCYGGNKIVAATLTH
jgi:hypothetical protein